MSSGSLLERRKGQEEHPYDTTLHCECSVSRAVRALSVGPLGAEVGPGVRASALVALAVEGLQIAPGLSGQWCGALAASPLDARLGASPTCFLGLHDVS